MSPDKELRILLVEDEQDSMDVLQETLLRMADLNWHFLKANDGRQALDILQREKLDLVIADILMPEMSGFAMLEEMNKAQIWIPCIFVTSLLRRDAGIEAMRLGAFDFVEKPLELSRIEGPVRKAIMVSLAFQRLWQEQQNAERPLHPAAVEVLKMRAMRFQSHAGEW